MEHLKLFREVCMRQGWQLDDSTITVPLDGGRKQRIESEAYAFEGEQMIRIYTRVGALKQLSETQLNALLSLNFSLAFGALASYGDDLVMTETFLLRESSHDQLIYAVRFMAETSDGYEAQIYGTDQY